MHTSITRTSGSSSLIEPTHAVFVWSFSNINEFIRQEYVVIRDTKFVRQSMIISSERAQLLKDLSRLTPLLEYVLDIWERWPYQKYVRQVTLPPVSSGSPSSFDNSPVPSPSAWQKPKQISSSPPFFQAENRSSPKITVHKILQP